jgi:hypothetical protein
MALFFRAFHPLNPIWGLSKQCAPGFVSHVVLAFVLILTLPKHWQAASSEGVA